MQFSVVAIFSLMALAYAAPTPRVDDLTVRAPPAEASVMTDSTGTVVAFDTTGVFQDTKAKGE